MNLRFVEAFYWAVMLKSVTRASEKLFVTQSALSSRIAALESELGVLLLDRRDKQFRLTAAGTRFHRHAERLLQMQSEIKAELGGGAPQSMLLRIGAIESVLHSWLMGWVQDLRRAQPGLELALVVETTPVLVDQMKRGAADVIVAALPAAADGVQTRALEAMEMVFVGQTARHGRKRYALAKLVEDDELLTFQRGSQPHVTLLELCRKQGVTASRVHTISSISAMVQLVEQGFGVATLPRAAVQPLLDRLGLCIVRCDAPLAPLPIHVSWRDDPASAAAGVLESLPGFPANARSARRARVAVSSKKSIKP
jgi:DNA-binding transcriptional LysR family regulator